MIRPFTAICVLLAGTSGLYLYSEKHRTTVLDQQISRIVQDTQRTRERTAMLRAEWALLNQPDRLQALAARYLPDLHPMAPTQFVQMAALAQHLPEIAKPAPAPAPAAPVAMAEAPQIAPMQVMARAVVSTDAASSEPVAAAEPVARPTPKHHAPARPVQLASASAAPAAPARSHAPARFGATFHAMPLNLVSARQAAPRTAPASHFASFEGRSVHGLVSTGSSYSHPAPIQAAWHPAYTPAPASAPVSGVRSSLGFAHVALPPPVPVRDGD